MDHKLDSEIYSKVDEKYVNDLLDKIMSTLPIDIKYINKDILYDDLKQIYMIQIYWELILILIMLLMKIIFKTLI